MNFLPTYPEIESSLGVLHIRQGLIDHSTTILLSDPNQWSPNTEQVWINDRIMHFVDPDGNVLGIN